MREAVITVVLAAAIAAPGSAQTPVCDVLAGAKRALAQRLLDTEHPWECCDDTISRCLAARPTCALAVRLADNVCRRVAAGQEEAHIRRALSRRARSMVGGGEVAAVAVDPAMSLGPEGAPVTLVVYACARCPFCSRLVPALAQEVRRGRLQGKVRLVFRVYPIRGHEGSTEAGLAFVAAAELGRFWDFALYSYQRFGEFCPDRQRDWAAAVGLDRDAFTERLTDPATRERLVASKKEGVLNGVEETPTVFINGRRWAGDLEIDELVDAAGEELDRLGGRQRSQP